MLQLGKTPGRILVCVTVLMPATMAVLNAAGALRPAVVSRKLSAGNRTEAGAETHAVLTSVLRTCSRQGRDILGVLGELLRRGPSHVIRLRPGEPAIPAAPSQG